MREDSFVRTLRDLEDTLTASHIAYFPVWCWASPHDEVELQQKLSPEGDDFSYVPVRNVDGRIRHVVHRGRTEARGEPVGYTRQGLTSNDVINARTPLKKAIEALKGRGFLLVRCLESRHPDGIGGIITHADVQKTPVRLLLFARLIEIETRLRRRVARTKWYERDDCKQERSSAEGKKKACKGDTLEALDSYLGVAELLRVTRRADATLFSKMDHAEFERHVRHVKEARNQVCHGLDVRGNHGAPATAASLSAAFRIIEDTMEAVSHLEHRQR